MDRVGSISNVQFFYNMIYTIITYTFFLELQELYYITFTIIIVNCNYDFEKYNCNWNCIIEYDLFAGCGQEILEIHTL